MTESIAERIAANLHAMPAGERRAAQALVANYPLLGLKTAAEFSSAAGTSAPTILRFVARLGFDSYPNFQASLQEELAARLQSPLARSDIGDEARGVHPMVDATIENLRETFNHLSGKQIEEIVTLLANPRSGIHMVGGRFTDPIARYMAAHLAIVRPRVEHLGGQDGNRRDRLVDMGRKDVLVIFDIRRYQDSLLAFAESAHSRGVQIVLVTDQWLSPIARFARHVVAGRTSVPSAWDSSAALFVIAETLIAATTRRMEEVSARRIREIETLR